MLASWFNCLLVHNTPPCVQSAPTNQHVSNYDYNQSVSDVIVISGTVSVYVSIEWAKKNRQPYIEPISIF